MSKLLDDLLATGNPGVHLNGKAATLTSRLEVKGGELTVELHDEAGVVNNQKVNDYLTANGYTPEEWQVAGMRRSEWTMANGEPGESVRYTFERNAAFGAQYLDTFEWERALANNAPAHVGVGAGDHGFVLAIGDLQVGKMDGDGIEGTIQRAFDYINQAAGTLEWYRNSGFTIGSAHIAWLGDHIEGFESQGGKNAWRTPLGLTDQLRIVRRIMLYAATTFAPLVDRLTMAAVPGNHGRVTAANGSLTRADDNFDTDCLIAVGDALAMNPEAYGHVELFIPGIDQVSVTVEVAGTVIGHVHGHQYAPGKHWTWWQGQQFGGALAGVDVLLAGHLHHFVLDTWGKLLFVQVPSLESESAWWRQRSGVPGNPGVVVALTSDGNFGPIEVIR